MKRLLCGWLMAVMLIGCGSDNRTDADLARCGRRIAAKPDSVRRALLEMPAERFASRARRARYALLLAEARDRTEAAPDNDSLLGIAWEYYRNRPNELYGQCKTLYYRGRQHLRHGDKPGALRLFLEDEERLRAIDEPYYTGLLYLRIGEVYHSELNFVRAYRYYRDARDLFLRSGNPHETAEALLGMTGAALRMRDLNRARRDCSMALDLADDLGDDTLRRRSLALFATLHIFPESEPIADGLLRRIEHVVRRDTSAQGYCTLAQTQLLRGRPDSALYYLRLADGRNPDTEVLPMLSYTAFRAHVAARSYHEASRAVHRFIYLTDSLTRTALQASAGMIEKEYFRERSAFADYRMQSRRTGERVTAVAVLLLLTLMGLFIRQRMRLQRERNERSLELLRDAREEYRRMAESLAEKHDTESRLRSMIASRFDIVDRLGKSYYERENTVSGQAAVARQVKQLIDGFAEKGKMLAELEQMVDEAHDGAMRKLRADFPRMKESDLRLLCYIFGGFSPQVISLFMEESVANVYARKSRLKSRIKASDSPHKGLFTALLEQA